MRTSEHVTLHFDLSDHPQDVKFTLLAGGGIKHVLTAYADAPGKLDEHRAANAALALIPDEHIVRITHFVEAAEIMADHPTVRRVVYPSLDDHSLPEIAMAFVHVPTKHYEQFVRMHPASAGHTPHLAMLADYGVHPDAIRAEDHDNVRLAAANVKPPRETAKTLVFHHVEIGSTNSGVASDVLDNFITQAPGFVDLVSYIQTNGPGTDNVWYQKSYSTWLNPDTQQEEPCPANLTLAAQYKDGKNPNWPVVNGTPQIPQYTLTDADNSQDDGVIGAATPAIQNVLLATKNADQFNGQLWSSQPGTTQKTQSGVAPQSPPRAHATARVMAAAAQGFGIKNTTSSYGLWLYDDELTFDSTTKTLSFPVKNWPSRYLTEYVQFLDSTGTPIKRAAIPGWPDSMPDFLKPVFEPSDSKNYLDWIGAGNSVFGIPIPPLTQKADVTFLWPDAATSARVLFGGLGVAAGFSDWDTDVCVGGVIGTGLICYGITALSMAFSTYVVNPWIASWSDDAKLALKIVGGLVGAVAAIVGVAEKDTSFGKSILTKLAGQVASIIFGVVVEQVAVAVARNYLLKTIGETVVEMTAEEVLEEIPIAGWAVRIAAIAADVAGLLATTIECLASPSVYVLEVDRTMDLTVTVSPDPAHGTATHKPNWPLVADHWIVQVKYPKSATGTGGTTLTKAGPMPGAHDQPLVIPFTGIPAGGKIEVVAGVYSENDWLAGQWDSGWISAVPDANDQLTTGGNIAEKLVPLTAATTYTQKQRLSYSDAAKHHWEVTRFSIDAALAATLDAAQVSPELAAAFAAQGNDLSNAVTITVTTAGSSWKLTDTSAGVVYQLDRTQTYTGDGQTQYEIEVQNLTNAAPTLPAVIQDCAQDGHRICQLQNITYNDKEYMVGYAWQASGQNMPRDDGTSVDNGQMYAFQAISALGQPQDQIVEPARGFTNPSFIAFDQFGIAPVFAITDKVAGSVAKAKAELDAGGGVPADIAKEIASFGVRLPAGAQVAVVAKDQRWTIGEAGQDPILDLRLEQEVLDEGGGSQLQSVINVYSWPVPSQDNFYLDSRVYSEVNKQYFIRGVSFAPGATTFDYDETTAWGQFQGVTISDLAFHPHGYIVGVDYDNHKLLTLKLGASPVPTAQAPIAMPLSGEGVREGLLQKPVALTITADGRILILEEANQRIQAFDVLGNPVPCFSVGQQSFGLDGALMAALDARDASTPLVQAFQRNVAPGTAPLFVEDDGSAPASVTALDGGTVDAALGAAFVSSGYATADAHGNPPPFTVTVTTAGSLWLVTDTTTSAAYDVRYAEDEFGLDHLYVFREFALGIEVTSAGAAWLITDTANAMTFGVTNTSTNPGKPNLVAKRLVSTMPLRTSGQPGVTHLDVAVETTGYVYTLSATATNGGAPTYALDVYMPDGTPLFEQQAVYAGKIAVDQWRSLFTLNYEKVLGPGQRTEPGISQWEPSTPAGSGPTG